MQQVLKNWRRAATAQTKDEIQQWASLVDTIETPALDDGAAAELFARMGEWYTSRALEHVAFDCYYRAKQLDSINVTYRTHVETLRSILKQRLGDSQ